MAQPVVSLMEIGKSFNNVRGDKGKAIGGEAFFDDNIVVYQITEAGVSLQATISGAKYQKDSELN